MCESVGERTQVPWSGPALFGPMSRDVAPRQRSRHACSRGAQVKQRGTPDPGRPFGPGRRGACTLADGARAPLFWDDAALPRHVVARLVDAPTSGGGRWLWSGAFEPAEREDYFGLRMHHVGGDGRRDARAVIVPVTVSVGTSGVVTVAFKSRRNLPPYRVVNACASVNVIVAQGGAEARPHGGLSLLRSRVPCSGPAR